MTTLINTLKTMGTTLNGAAYKENRDGSVTISAGKVKSDREQLYIDVACKISLDEVKHYMQLTGDKIIERLRMLPGDEYTIKNGDDSDTMYIINGNTVVMSFSDGRTINMPSSYNIGYLMSTVATNGGDYTNATDVSMRAVKALRALYNEPIEDKSDEVNTLGWLRKEIVNNLETPSTYVNLLLTGKQLLEHLYTLNAMAECIEINNDNIVISKHTGAGADKIMIVYDGKHGALLGQEDNVLDVLVQQLKFVDDTQAIVKAGVKIATYLELKSAPSHRSPVTVQLVTTSLD